MSSLLAGVKSYSEQDTEWAFHPLATLIWQVVNEEHRAKRQGRQSALRTPIWEPKRRDKCSKRGQEDNWYQQTRRRGTASSVATQALGSNVPRKRPARTQANGGA